MKTKLGEHDRICYCGVIQTPLVASHGLIPECWPKSEFARERASNIPNPTQLTVDGLGLAFRGRASEKTEMRWLGDSWLGCLVGVEMLDH